MPCKRPASGLCEIAVPVNCRPATRGRTAPDFVRPARPCRRRPWQARPGPATARLVMRSGRRDQPELLKHGNAVVEADFLGDEPVLDLQYAGSGEPPRLARGGRQGPDRHVVECRTGVRAAAFPLAYHVVPLGDEVSGAPEVQVREGRAELLGEGPDLLAAAARRVQRVLEADIRRGEFVDHGWIEVLASKLGERAPHCALVLLQ